jgi:hypothetical protein
MFPIPCIFWNIHDSSTFWKNINYIYIYVPNYKHQTCSSPSPVQNIIHGAEIKKGKLNNDRLQSSQWEHKPFIWVIHVFSETYMILLHSERISRHLQNLAVQCWLPGEPLLWKKNLLYELIIGQASVFSDHSWYLHQ